MIFYPKLEATVLSLKIAEIPSKRIESLEQIIIYIEGIKAQGETAKLNFICTHNSRRSQMAQVWAETAAAYYDIDIACYSGGVEVTEINQNTIETLRNAGFEITKEGVDNPTYLLSYDHDSKVINCFSKLYDDAANPKADFVAVMTCSEADKNCPFISGADLRISLLYDDPKEFDDSPLMSINYSERSAQIGAEMFFIFSKLNS